MEHIEQIQAIVAKGLALRQPDIEEIQFLFTQAPVDAARAAEPWIWEAVALIVNDPAYEGDAKIPADA